MAPSVKLAIVLVALLALLLMIVGGIRRALTVATGYGIYIFLGQLYDYVLWPLVQGYHGMAGAVAMPPVFLDLRVEFGHQLRRMDTGECGGVDCSKNSLEILTMKPTKAENYPPAIVAIQPSRIIPGQVELFTLRDILPGEELCYGYSTTVPPGWSSADWSMECR